MTLDTCKCEDRLTEVVLLGGRREEGGHEGGGTGKLE